VDLISVEDHIPINAAEEVVNGDGRQPCPLKALRSTVPLIASAGDGVVIDASHLREEVSNATCTGQRKLRVQELNRSVPIGDPLLL